MNSFVFFMLDTSLSTNIGLAARCLKNFGLVDLNLVCPNVLIDENAIRAAKHAYDIVNSIKIYDDLSHAVEDCNYLIGLSARKRDMLIPQNSLKQSLSNFQNKSLGKIGLLFGSEKHGLTNKQLAFCDEIIYIPTNVEYASMNIAMAMNIVAYEISNYQVSSAKVDLISGAVDIVRDMPNIASRQYFYEKINDWIGKIESSQLKKNKLIDKIGNVFSRANLDHSEMNAILGLLKKSENN